MHHEHLELCKYILEVNGGENPGNRTEDTPLHHAAELNKKEFFQMIFEKTSSKNPGNVKGITPLHIAAAQGHLEIVKMITENVDDLSPRDNKGRNKYFPQFTRLVDVIF